MNPSKIVSTITLLMLLLLTSQSWAQSDREVDLLRYKIRNLKDQIARQEEQHLDERYLHEHQGNQLRDELGDLTTEIQNRRLEVDRSKKVYGKILSELSSTNQALKSQLERRQTPPDFTSPDGKIIDLDAERKTATLDIGTAAKTPLGLVLHVDKETQIQVVKLLGSNRSLAKIIQVGAKSPAIGDSVTSPIWNSGDRFGVAIAGMIDLDNDLNDDRQVVLRELNQFGAEIDFEVDGNGETLGEGIRPTTRFLVAVYQNDYELNGSVREAVARANELGVPVISLDTLDEMLDLRTPKTWSDFEPMVDAIIKEHMQNN